MTQPPPPGCQCEACVPQRRLTDVLADIARTGRRQDYPRPTACRTCGHHRCPRAWNHENRCTGRDAPDQRGSHDGLIRHPRPYL